MMAISSASHPNVVLRLASSCPVEAETLGSHIRHCILSAVSLGDDVSRLQVLCCSTLPAASVSCDYLPCYLLVAPVGAVDGAGVAGYQMISHETPDHGSASNASARHSANAAARLGALHTSASPCSIPAKKPLVLPPWQHQLSPSSLSVSTKRHPFSRRAASTWRHASRLWA